MEIGIEIFHIVLPIILVGAISLFVILRLKEKQKRGTLAKKETTAAQSLLDSLIPLGMVCGTALGLVLSIFLPFSMATGITFGAGLGLLGGYFAYEFYSKQEEPNIQ
ncbi:hypothetical protein [Planococcus halotolerans]|uniref:Uncharacterized protein n=1 Tax=Planococcus halotolerans TaxID=2233542 RepID=A0A365KX84_9BACL|nr:hypothetical protein [Planococcus halotolerans]QHJ72196.1 hypothetical protein DNR44_017010 [Planococcus halotolerans]RAZ77786.1 hypothetical protein DP120_09920 [Planococcus halotolerans]